MERLTNEMLKAGGINSIRSSISQSFFITDIIGLKKRRELAILCRLSNTQPSTGMRSFSNTNNGRAYGRIIWIENFLKN